MKRFTVIGIGNFGGFVASRLFRSGYDVIAIDKDEQVVDRIGPNVSRAVAGDATTVELLRELGVRESDAAIVATGGNLAASVLILLALRDLGVDEIYVKVTSREHMRIADALGATEAIFPEREAAEGLATRLTSGKLLKYVELGEEFSLQEMAVPDAWHGKSLRSLELPVKYHVQIVAVHDVLRDTVEIPDPVKPLTPSDTLLVAGKPRALEELVRVK